LHIPPLKVRPCFILSRDVFQENAATDCVLVKEVNHLSYPENISKECSVSHWKYMLWNHAPMRSVHRLHHDLQIEPIFRSQYQAFQKTYLFHKSIISQLSTSLSYCYLLWAERNHQQNVSSMLSVLE
jgi:hypothetical protein